MDHVDVAMCVSGSVISSVPVVCLRRISGFGWGRWGEYALKVQEIASGANVPNVNSHAGSDNAHNAVMAVI